MAARLTRCLCGKIFDASENSCCPACGAELRIEMPKPPPVDSAGAKSETVSPTPAVPPKPAPDFSPRPIQMSITTRQLKWACAGVLAAGVAIAAYRWLPPSPDKLVVKPDKELKEDPEKEKPKPSEPEPEKKVEEKKEILELPKPTPTPAPAPDPSAPRNWIVDAENGAGADGAELPAIIGKVRDGDTVTLRPGGYTGGFKIDKKIRIVGESAAGGHGRTIIKGSGDANVITVTASGVTFANLQIVQDKMHSAPALILEKGAEVVFENIQTKFNSPLGILGRWVSSITATGCSFNTNGGAALLASGHETDGIAQIKLTDCTFSGGQRAFICAMKTRAEVRKCRFQDVGHKAEKGAALSTTGEDSQMTIEDCTFTGCRLPVEAENAMLALRNCTFTDNGVNVEPGAFTQGIIAVRQKAKAMLTGVTFESNRQGIVATGGSTVELTGCNFTGCGLETTDANFALLCVPLHVKDNGSTITVRKGSFTRSVPHAICATEGGAVFVEDCDFSGTADTALLVGQTSTIPSRAEVKKGRFTGNQYGAVITGGGTATFEDCEFRQNSLALISQDTASRVNLTRGTIAESREGSILAQNEGILIASEVSIDGNKRGVQAGQPGKPEARATVTLADCKLLANETFDVNACQQSRVTLNRCSFAPDTAPKIFKEKGAIITTEPPIEGIVETAPGATKKGSSSASNNRGSSSKGRSTPSGRPPPPDPVRDIIRAVDSVKRMFRR